MSRASIIVLSLILVFLPAHPSYADVRDTGVLAIRTGLLNFDMREFDEQGERLVRESGLLYGINADFGLRGKQIEIRLGAAYYGGEVDYDGQTQANVPINSSTRERIVDVSLMLVYHLPSVAVPALSLYGGPGYRSWRREIQPVGTVSGLDESYRWWKFQAGMDMSWARGKNRWVLDGRVIRSLNPGVDVDLGAGFETTELNLGDSWGWRVGGRWARMLSPRLEAVFDLFYERQSLGRSDSETLRRNGLPVGSIFQPRIEMKNSGIFIGLRQTW